MITNMSFIKLLCLTYKPTFLCYAQDGQGWNSANHVFTFQVYSLLNTADREFIGREITGWRRKKGLVPSCLFSEGFFYASCSYEHHPNNVSSSWQQQYLPIVAEESHEPFFSMRRNYLIAQPPLIDIRALLQASKFQEI